MEEKVNLPISPLFVCNTTQHLSKLHQALRWHCAWNGHAMRLLALNFNSNTPIRTT